MKNKIIFCFIFFMSYVMLHAQISFTPKSSPIGSTFTISSTNLFNSISGNNFLFIGGAKCTLFSATLNTIVAVVPLGAVYDRIQYVNLISGLQFVSNEFFLPLNTSTGIINNSKYANLIPINQSFTPSLSWMVKTVDLDNDGKLDIISTERTNGKLLIARNKYSGVWESSMFQDPIVIDVGTEPVNLNFVDLNCDGKIDIIVSCLFNNYISIIKNNHVSGDFTSSSFATPVTFVTCPSIGNRGINFGDFNSDGGIDIAVSIFNTNSISILQSNGANLDIDVGKFKTYISLNTQTNPRGLTVGDFNNDNKADIACVNQGSNSITYFTNQHISGDLSSTSFSSNSFTIGTSPMELEGADFDSDGKLDLFANNNDDFTVSIIKNISVGTVTGFSVLTVLGTGIKNFDLSVSDMNGDQKPDILVSLEAQPESFLIFENNVVSNNLNATSFTSKTPFSFNIFSYAPGIETGDIDNDNINDIIFTGGNSSSPVYILKGIGFVVTSPGSVIAPSNLTVTSNAINTAPILDGVLSDAAWVANPLITSILNRINICDGGTAAPNIPPTSSAGSNYTGKAASFATTWDADYLYLAVNVTDAEAATDTTAESVVDLFLNNGNGRSSHPNITTNFPRAYNDNRDAQIGFNVGKLLLGNNSNTLTLANAGLYTNGIQFMDTDIQAVAKRTAQGYILEARINWKKINKEFISTVDGVSYTDNSKTPSASRVPFGFDISANFRATGASCRNSVQLMWNQCCFNRNWTESASFGTLKLAGVPFTIISVTSATISGLNTITLAGGNITLTSTYAPTNANTNTLVGWSTTLNGIATFNTITRVLTASNNGNGLVTISGRYGTVTSSIIVTISGQCVPLTQIPH